MADIRLVRGTSRNRLLGIGVPGDAADAAVSQDHLWSVNDFHSVTDAAAMNATRAPFAKIGDLFFTRDNSRFFQVTAISTTDITTTEVETVTVTTSPDGTHITEITIDGVQHDVGNFPIETTGMGLNGNGQLATPLSLDFTEIAQQLNVPNELNIDGRNLELRRSGTTISTVTLPASATGGSTVVANPSGTDGEPLNRIRIDDVNYRIEGGGASPLPVLQQAIQVTKLADRGDITLNSDGAATTVARSYNGMPFTQEIVRDANGAPVLVTWGGDIITAFAREANAPMGADLLEQEITRNPQGAVTNTRYFFGAGDEIIFNFDITRGVFSETRDVLQRATITDRGTFNIDTGFMIDSRGQVTEVS